MTTLKVSDLSIHPMNEYYFDDMSGEKWDQFLKSVKSNGVRTPIIVTDDMRVVSGNQRVRACKELGISVINAEIEHYANEDDVVRDLIEINIRQRGAIDDSEIKQSRRITFLQKYYGIKQGGSGFYGNQHVESPNDSATPKTQVELASELGMSVDTLENYAKLQNLIPEIQELVDTGVVTKTVALSILKQLSPEEQKQLAEDFANKEKITGRDVDFYKKRIQSQQEEIDKLRNQKPEVRIVEKKIEVVPADYEQLKSSLKSAEKERQQYADEILEAKKRIRELETPSNDEKIVDEAKYQMDNFSIATYNYIRRYGGFVWAFDKWGDIPDGTKKNFTDAINALDGFVQQMKINLKGVK